MAIRPPTYRLLAGLAVTLLAVGVYSFYTFLQLRSLGELQTRTIDRNRSDSLLLLRIQNALNSLGLTLRDMADSEKPYALTAWQQQCKMIRADLENALAREEKVAPAERPANQRKYVADSFRQFWDALDRTFNLAREGETDEAQILVRMSLQARHASLVTAVSRLLVANQASEQAAEERTREIYAGVERNVYVFSAAMVVVIVLTSLYLVQYNRRLFQQIVKLSERRSELAKQLIAMQENTFRSISMELHDDFGQILTAVGAILRRADKKSEDLIEVREIVQITLDKVRSLSHALHPVVLDEAGLESALDVYLPGYERQTGIAVEYVKSGEARELGKDLSIHVYRILQEALNNVAKHSASKRVFVRLRFEGDLLALEVEDEGIGFQKKQSTGLGLVSMRERAGMVNGSIEFVSGAKGALVRLTAPMGLKEAHA